jgi:hypothetical protein
MPLQILGIASMAKGTDDPVRRQRIALRFRAGKMILCGGKRRKRANVNSSAGGRDKEFTKIEW